MKPFILSLVMIASVFATSAAFAQAPAGAPSGSTGLCKDGSYTSNETKKGACAGHKGVRDWFESAPAASTAAKTAAAASAPAATTLPAKTTPAATKTAGAPAAGGGAGQVWVNSNSKVYHCFGTRYYGKTKQGEYMTEAAAKAAGNHADHGKACAS